MEKEIKKDTKAKPEIFHGNAFIMLQHTSTDGEQVLRADNQSSGGDEFQVPSAGFDGEPSWHTHTHE